MSKAVTWQVALVLVIASGCTQDYDQFSSPERTPGTGGNSGGFGGAVGNAGASGSAGAFGSGGAAGTEGNSGTSGSAGTSACNAGQKLCAGACIASNDPATGCAEASCDACSSENAVPTCRDGECAVESCASGFGNCDNQAGDGCEQELTDDEHCGSCRNDCTSQGSARGFACVSGVCGCTSDDQCRDFGGTGIATCNTTNRTCVCETTECRPGESCERQGSVQLCRCNGGNACTEGQTCCESPDGCRSLDTDIQNCGACGKACPMGFACQQGLCACSSDTDCNAGSAGTCVADTGSSRCSCGGVVCAPGQRCFPGDRCG
jgi:hypothetical protein